MNIRVFNDGKEVFTGPISEFLEDNDHDEWLTKECEKLNSTDVVEFREISGDWRIIKQ